MSAMINRCLDEMIPRGASDLFLSVGKPPAMRINGDLKTLGETILTPEDFDSFLKSAVSARSQSEFAQNGDLDVGYSSPTAPDVRFRLNFYRQGGQMGMVARALPSGALDLLALGLPEITIELAKLPRGLVLVTGATGSGKSTTMAALINAINQTRAAHIVTVEDPIEFIHKDVKSRISQREVGTDTSTFASALRHVVRESPDVIVIGEMRDRETVEVAISAAMTGHLVLSTLHTIDASQSILRLLGLFPEASRSQLCLDLSMSLAAIISQRLLPKKDGKGRALAVECLRFTPGAAQLLREARVEELGDFMRTNRDPGIIPFNQSLVSLYRHQQIDFETGLTYSNNPDEFRLAAIGMRTGVSGFTGEDELLATRSDMQALLGLAIEQGASDVHLSVGRPPLFRVGGHLHRIGEEPLNPADVRWLLFSLLSGRQRSQLELEKELDFSLQLESGIRFRVNAYYQRGHMAVALRSIPSHVPTPEQLGLPKPLEKLLDRPQGLILVVGPTGSGKTTTVASLIDRINKSRACHIITVEDPIEYSYESAMAAIDQREVFADTRSFSAALKYILRQDPDIILVGEMRDLETISAVLTAAETGHLVFATLHTNDAPSTIDRIVDVFPAHQQQQIRIQLAASLVAVVSQRLLPKIDGSGRIGAYELLIATGAVRALVREGKSHQLPNVLSTSSDVGMKSMDRALVDLVQSGKVEMKEAARFISDLSLLKRPMSSGPATERSSESAQAHDPLDLDEDEINELNTPDPQPRKGLGAWFSR
jgi:pilus retraction protein PilT